MEDGRGALEADGGRGGGGYLLLDQVAVGALVHVVAELGGGDAEALAQADELVVGVAGAAFLGLLGVEAGVEVGELALLGGGDGGVGGQQGVAGGIGVAVEDVEQVVLDLQLPVGHGLGHLGPAGGLELAAVGAGEVLVDVDLDLGGVLAGDHGAVVGDGGGVGGAGLGDLDRIGAGGDRGRGLLGGEDHGGDHGDRHDDHGDDADGDVAAVVAGAAGGRDGAGGVGLVPVALVVLARGGLLLTRVGLVLVSLVVLGRAHGEPSSSSPAGQLGGRVPGEMLPTESWCYLRSPFRNADMHRSSASAAAGISGA